MLPWAKLMPEVFFEGQALEMTVHKQTWSTKSGAVADHVCTAAL